MRTLIVFSSKYGATQKCAESIKNGLKHDVSLVNLRNQTCSNIDDYDVILIGSAIYAGKIPKEISTFLNENKKELLTKKIGLFLCCKEEGLKAQNYLKDNFPDWVYERAFIKEHLGHGINFKKMNFIEKVIIKSLIKIKESYLDLKHDNIERVINTVNRLDDSRG